MTTIDITRRWRTASTIFCEYGINNVSVPGLLAEKAETLLGNLPDGLYSVASRGVAPFLKEFWLVPPNYHDSAAAGAGNSAPPLFLQGRPIDAFRPIGNLSLNSICDDGFQDGTFQSVELKRVLNSTDAGNIRVRLRTSYTLHTLSVVRKWATTKSTISEFKVLSGGTLTGFFLERPGPDTVTSGQRLRIPEGHYRLKWYDATGENIAPHNPLPLLYNHNVAEGRWILIHNGNKPEHSDGCLLAGSSKSTDRVNSSVSKLNAIKNYLNDVQIENVRVVITSDYQ